VGSPFEYLDVLFKCLMLSGWKSPGKEAFSDIIHCLEGRMAHIFRIKTVVS
jgi:hypothetical protein